MMYTKSMFGKALKKLVWQKRDIIEIGDWVNAAYWEYCDQLEPGLRRAMIDLATMSNGPEFAISYEMLNKITDDLIAGKDVDLNAEEYRDNNDILG
jgi:hypothetical protein